jgi:hypothetical protein
MSEYTNVERPFLDKHRQLGWEVIDQWFKQDIDFQLSHGNRVVVL